MFLKREFLYLEDVFALARMQSVNADPKNKQQLEALMGIEKLITSKMNQANEKLGFEEAEDIEVGAIPEIKEESPLEAVSDQSVQD